MLGKHKPLVEKLLSRADRSEELAQTSFDACIFLAILSVQLCGAWQSEQIACRPERFEKFVVANSG